MTSVMTALRRLPEPDDTLHAALRAGGLTVGAVAAGFAIAQPHGAAFLLPLAAAALTLGIAVTAPTALVFATVGWLVVLGLVRRFGGVGSTPLGDPLLLVGPSAIVALLIVAIERGAMRNRTPLANTVLVLSCLTLLGALNPLQGSLVAGIAALLFSLVPLLAFWIGRICTDETLARVMKMAAALGLCVALYGLYQTLHGFPSWDSRWITKHAADFHSLFIDGRVRPFATFSSPADYAFFLAIALVVWLTFGLQRARAAIVVPVVVLLGTALIYVAVRGAVVLVIFAAGLMLAARRGAPIVGSLATGAVLLLLLSFAASHFAGAPTTQYAQSATSTEPLIAHQVNGLANPLSAKNSTLSVHASLVKEGVVAAVHEPFGIGIAAVTRAGSKLGGTTNNTEADPSNAAVALGIPGLVAYVALFFFGVRSAYRVAVTRRSPVALASLGVVAVTMFQWLNGSQYAVALLAWLVFGWIDRASLSEPGEGER